MNTYLLTWNDKWWPWKGLASCAKKVRAGHKVEESWSCSNTHVVMGDRVFLLKQGKEQRGLMASGWVTSEPYPGETFRQDSASKGKIISYINFDFDVLLDPVKDALLHTSVLQSKISNGPSNFTPQSSGTIVEKKTAKALEKLWQEHLDSLELEVEVVGFEGMMRRYFTAHRRRENSLRSAKIEEVLTRNGGRLQCQVPKCEFDFSFSYGELGRDFAHVHHLAPLASSDTSRPTLLKDLVVVCANCHAMIHRNGECRDYRTLIEK